MTAAASMGAVRADAMTSAAWRGRAERLSGNRLHLQDGPIDLVIRAWGPAAAVEAAYERATNRFRHLLDGLVRELPLLRARTSTRVPSGRVARRMWSAARQFEPRFATPMVAVAGSVADEILSTMTAVAGVDRAYVNNGGDIALLPGAARGLRVGIVPLEHLRAGGIPITGAITRETGIGGVATSGWRGRSHSLGIADAVTVLAATGAAADAAATLIANEVDVDAPGIGRMPAAELDPDSDLGRRLVTVAVAPLDRRARDDALRRGRSTAIEFYDRGLILGAFIMLQDRWVEVGTAYSAAHSLETPMPRRWMIEDAS